ncbi:MAG: 30S ribosomal protein S14 type Z [Candidatus Heimdallarchaeota archaeon AB_125]|jgi:small subunit ribosomal protein S14|nr:MAG: 30S ribosomal protein S14 type Z [Candidatus Heimdallarchaeota archaeon AB_125]
MQEKRVIKYGKGSRKCRRCGTHQAVIRRGGLYVCRRCIREIYDKIGFKKTGSRGG